MRIVYFLTVFFLTQAGLGSFVEADDRPDVVFILTDDQRSDALSCMGHPHLKTPRIDQLAAEGALFKNHFCTTSLCSPSRASILGGLYAHTHGVSDPDWRTSWYYEYNYEVQFPYTPNVRALRTDEWKYIRYPHGDGSPDKHMAELYNLKSDPGETTNLIKEEKYQSLVAELRAELDGRIKEAIPDGEDTMPMDEGIKGELPDEKIR